MIKRNDDPFDMDSFRLKMAREESRFALHVATRALRLSAVSIAFTVGFVAGLIFSSC